MANLIGALRVSLSADTAKFSAGMDKAQRKAATSSSAITKSLGTIKSGLVGLASGLSLGLLTNVIRGALDYAGSLGEVSQQLGVTTRDLQVFRYAAGQNGVAQDELDKGLGKLTITLGQVAAGAKAPTKALEAIGITAKDLAGLDTGAAFRKIADGLAQVTDRSQRAAVEVALFGRSGAKLDTLLAGGSAGINELALAAEKLGIVLSDEQIQKADQTADKLDAVQTVLKAQIAGVVADNAAAIMTLANSLVYLIAQAGQAAAKMTAFYRSLAIDSARWAAANPTLAKVAFGTKGTATILRAGAGAMRGNAADRAPKAAPVVVPAGGNNVGNFLAGGGGGGRRARDTSGRDAERARLDGIRDAFRLEEDIRRSDMDILRAKQDLAPTYIERAALEIQMLDLERRGYQAELANQVALGEMTQTQAAERQARFDIADGLKREAVLVEEEVNRQREYNALDDKDFDIKRDILQKQIGLAETAGERRALEMEMLRIEYDHRRMVLERIMRESKDYAEIESARRELANLPANQRADTEGVTRGTRGPLEEYLSGIPDTAAKMEEAFQSVQVNAIDGIVQGLSDAATGAQKLGDVFKNVARSIIQDLIRIALQKAIVGALGKALGSFGGIKGGTSTAASGSYAGVDGGLFNFASGGAFTILGNKGRDKNIMSLNGLPIANVSHGERVNISNDNANASGGGSAKVTIVPTPYFDAHVDGRAANVAAPMASRAAMVGAAGGQQATARQQRRSIP